MERALNLQAINGQLCTNLQLKMLNLFQSLIETNVGVYDVFCTSLSLLIFLPVLFVMENEELKFSTLGELPISPSCFCFFYFHALLRCF